MRGLRVERGGMALDAGAAPRGDEELRIAAIDIGSNSIRQIVADVSGTGAIRVVDEMKAMPRLGAGLEESGELSDTAMQTAIEALARMATLARQLGARRIEAVATSAVRDASNGRQFLELAKRQTGLRIRVLNGEEEARLSFLSALAHFELASGRTVVADIGGGSLELALSAEGVLEHLVSLPLGAIRLTEHYLAKGITRKRVRRLRKGVRRALRAAIPLREWRAAQVIGSGGTFTNLAAMYGAKKQMATARTRHGTLVPRIELEHIFDLLVDMSPEERLGVPGLNPARADIIVAGLAVAAEVLARIGARDLLVSGYGIREGLLLETARVTPPASDPGEARRRSVREFAERCHYEEPHARHVQTLALQLFDSIGERLECEDGDREILEDAALLHDVGYHINYTKHHKHSYHLILHADLLGISPLEQVIVANVARYHRGARPKRKHRNYGSLDSGSRRQICRLSAILRVADGFDRGHAGAVERIRTRWGESALRLTALPIPAATSLRLDLWGASRKSSLLSRVAGTPVVIAGPGGVVVDDEDDESSGWDE